MNRETQISPWKKIWQNKLRSTLDLNLNRHIYPPEKKFGFKLNRRDHTCWVSKHPYNQQLSALHVSGEDTQGIGWPLMSNLKLACLFNYQIIK